MSVKRFLSWLALAVTEWVFGLAVWYLIKLAIWLFNIIHGKSEAVAWALLIMEGTAAIGLAFFLIMAGCYGIVAISQKVCKSKNGGRYLVFGIITTVLTGTVLGLTIAGFVRGGDLVLLGIYCGIMALFGLFLISTGKERALDARKEAENGQDA